MIKNIKLWHKFIAFTFAILIILSVFMGMLVYNTSVTNKTYQELVNNVVLLNHTYRLLDESLNELELYLTTKEFKSVESFNRKFDELYKAINSMPLEFTSQEEQIAYNNLRGMLISLSQQIDKTIAAARGRNPLLATEKFSDVELVYNDMIGTINYLVFTNMSASQEMFAYMESNRNVFLRQTLIIFGGMVLLSIFAIVVFFRKITLSLTLLTEKSLKISQFPEEFEQIDIGGNDEIGLLSSAFNTMGTNIKKYINEINEKAVMEKELREIEVKNLSMKNMLNGAELKALQAQINPHFLFNTLNCIAQTSMIEEATDTYKLILKVSAMMRYNLRRLDIPVQFREEIENLKRYIFIQKMRYGDKIVFNINIDDESINKLLIPCLSIQPIVENSVIHGFENCEKARMVNIDAYSDEDLYIVEISDNGVGMDENTISKITEMEEEQSKGHSTGIGIQNVISRLSLFYKRDVVKIESELGKGTCVKFMIPKDFQYTIVLDN